MPTYPDALEALNRFHSRVRTSVRQAALLSLLLALPGVAACQRSEATEKPKPPALSAEERALGALTRSNYAEIAYATYSDATQLAKAMLAEVDRFLAEPTAERLASTRAAWSAARRPYQQSEVFRFYDGPIDRFETQINTWPIDENYVEAFETTTKPGIIEDTERYPRITAALLSALNASEGETSISTGYHVIEFLLWGRDKSNEGPGDRSFEDYRLSRPGEKANGARPRERLAAERRGQYLRAAGELLVHQLSEVCDAWAPGVVGNYRDQFIRLPLSKALGLAIKGMGSLSGPELAGERLTVPYETKDQENEHSCFSDTTQTDLYHDALGIRNVCLGRYRGEGAKEVSGPGLCDVVARRDGPLAEQLRRQLSASVEALRRIPTPFDQAILGGDEAPGRKAIHGAIEALRTQTDTLAKVAALFDLRVSSAEPRVVR